MNPPAGSAVALAAHYDAEAAAYEELWAPVLTRPGCALLDALPLADARHVIDVGAGVGALLSAVSAAAPHATVIAVDRSFGMLQRTSSTFPRALMDAAAIAFRAATFDGAIMAFVLFHLADPRRALEQVRRILRPGGVLGTLTWGRDSRCPALAAFTEALDARHAPPDPCPARHDLVDHPDKMSDLLTRSGFVDVRSWSGWVEHQESQDVFLRRVTSGGPTGRRFDLLGGSSRREFLTEVRDALERKGPEDFHTRREVVFATARVLR